MADRAASKKTAGKSAIPKIRQPHGGALHAGGVPGNKGGSGRPPGSFKQFLSDLRAAPDFQEAIKAAATDPSSKGFGHVLRLVSEYDDDKPAEKRQIVGPVEVRVRVTREGRRTTAS